MSTVGARGFRQIQKIKKNRFLSMECFTADVLQFFTEKRQDLALRWLAGHLPSTPSILGIFLKFPNFLKSEEFFFLCGHISAPSGEHVVGKLFDSL